MKNRKGFTLIEILAVIIIIGIVGIIGVVSVSKYVEDSRKSTFIDSASRYVEGARNLKVSDKLIQEPKNAEALMVPLSLLEFENELETPYGEIDTDKSYVIIANDSGKYSYYISIIDTSGHALVLTSSSELSEDKILTSDQDTSNLVSMSAIKNGNATININGLEYQLSDRNNENAETVLLSYSILDGFRVDVFNTGWYNQDKEVVITTATGYEGYKFYLYDRSMKPLRDDPEWESYDSGSSNKKTYLRDNGIYYAFIMSPEGEVSEGKKVVVDKIDKIVPTCSLTATGGHKSSFGIYNSATVIEFSNKSDGASGPTTSGIGSFGIGDSRNATVLHSPNGPYRNNIYRLCSR